LDLDFAILADGVTPRPDGKLDIHGAGFDTVFAHAVPVQHARLVVAVRVCSPPAKPRVHTGSP
jgi:hypothetical protein